MGDVGTGGVVWVMFGNRSSSRKASRATAPTQDAKLKRAPIQTNSRAFANDDPTLNLDSQDGFMQSDGTVRVRTSNIRLVTKFFIATLSSLGLSISIYILIPSIPTYLSANLVPAISNLQSPPTASDELQPNETAKSIMNKAGSSLEAKLQNIAYRIIQSDNWDAQKLHYFKITWVGLNQQQQDVIKDTVWYQMFERALRGETNAALKNLSDDDDSYSPQVRALLALALNLDVLKSRRRDVAPRYKKSAVNDTSRRSKDNDNTVVAKLQPAIRTPIEQDSPATEQEILIEDSQLLNSQQDSVDTDPAQETVDINRYEYGLRPTYSELSDITVQFVDAYETGNLEKFTSLFTRNAVSNEQNDRSGIKNQYEKIFASTTERQMFIHDLKWSFRKNIAIGKGTLELMIISTNEAGVLSQKGRVQLVAERQRDKILIKRFYYLTE